MNDDISKIFTGVRGGGGGGGLIFRNGGLGFDNYVWYNPNVA